MARNSHGGKKIDTVHWTLGAFGASAFAAGTVAVTAASAQHLPETLLRTRGEVTVYADGAQAPGKSARITLGLILVPEGTGTTVLWSPETDGDAPWLWWEVFHLSYEEMVIDTIDVPSQTGARRVIDSKAMRKIRNREIQFVAENTTVIGAMNVNVAGAVRFLAGS